MILVNQLEFEWEEGMTVETLLEKIKEDGRLRYLVNPAIMVIVNQRLVPPDDYAQRLIQDGDLIKLKMPMAGG